MNGQVKELVSELLGRLTQFNLKVVHAHVDDPRLSCEGLCHQEPGVLSAEDTVFLKVVLLLPCFIAMCFVNMCSFILFVGIFPYAVCWDIAIFCLWVYCHILSVGIMPYSVCGDIMIFCMWAYCHILFVGIFPYAVCWDIAIFCLWVYCHILSVGILPYSICGDNAILYLWG